MKISPLKNDPLVHILKSDSISSLPYQEQKFSFVSWGIEQESLAKASKNVGHLFKRYDFIAFQEIDLPTIKKLVSKAPYSLFAPSFLYQGLKTGNSIHSRYLPNRHEIIIGKSKAPFLKTQHSTLVVHFNGLKIINTNTHEYVKVEEWKNDIEQVLVNAQQGEQRVLLTGNFSLSSKDREEFLFKKMESLGFQRIAWKERKRCPTPGPFFTKGLILRSAETFPVGNSQKCAMELVLQPRL